MSKISIRYLWLETEGKLFKYYLLPLSSIVSFETFQMRWYPLKEPSMGDELNFIDIVTPDTCLFQIYKVTQRARSVEILQHVTHKRHLLISLQVLLIFVWRGQSLSWETLVCHVVWHRPWPYNSFALEDSCLCYYVLLSITSQTCRSLHSLKISFHTALIFEKFCIVIHQHTSVLAAFGHWLGRRSICDLTASLNISSPR